MTQLPIEPTSKPKARKPLWRRIVKWTARVVVAMVVIAGVAFGIFNYTSSNALENEISKIQAAGQPLTFSQLDQSQPKVPEADDAAPFYKAAIALSGRDIAARTADALDKLGELREAKDKAVDPELAAETEALLATNALAFDMVDRGSQRPRCAYDFGLSSGIPVVMPQLSDARALCRAMCLRTVWLARRGQAGKAVGSFVSSLRMLRMFDRQPVLITYLVKIACTASCVNTLPSVLEAGQLTDQELAKLDAALVDVGQSQDMRKVFLADRVYLLELWRNLISPQRRLELGDASNLPDSAPPGNIASRPVFRMMMVRQLQMFDQYIAAGDKQWPEILDAMRACNGPTAGYFGMFAQILAPSYSHVLVNVGRGTGWVRSARVAVMVERYRLAKGRLPASLDKLRQFTGTDLPTDPFTGKALVFKTQGDGFMVYSVGDDKSDDGGLKDKDWGVSVRMPRPAATPASRPN